MVKSTISKELKGWYELRARAQLAGDEKAFLRYDEMIHQATTERMSNMMQAQTKNMTEKELTDWSK